MRLFHIRLKSLQHTPGGGSRRDKHRMAELMKRSPQKGRGPETDHPSFIFHMQQGHFLRSRRNKDCLIPLHPDLHFPITENHLLTVGV
ncbi:hypothetical protein D3C75_950070 [compost metagenome]